MGASNQKVTVTYDWQKRQRLHSDTWTIGDSVDTQDGYGNWLGGMLLVAI